MKKRMKFSDLLSRYFVVALFLFSLATKDIRADDEPPPLPDMNTLLEDLPEAELGTEGGEEPPATELNTDPNEGIPSDQTGDDDTITDPHDTYTPPDRTYTPPTRTTTPPDYTPPDYTPPPSDQDPQDDGDDDGDTAGDNGDDKKDPIDNNKNQKEEEKKVEPKETGAVVPTPNQEEKKDNEDGQKATTPAKTSVKKAYQAPKKLISSGPESFLLFGIALCASFFGYLWTKERNYKL